jgi:hypothetical protein
MRIRDVTTFDELGRVCLEKGWTLSLSQTKTCAKLTVTKGFFRQYTARCPKRFGYSLDSLVSVVCSKIFYDE